MFIRTRVHCFAWKMLLNIHAIRTLLTNRNRFCPFSKVTCCDIFANESKAIPASIESLHAMFSLWSDDQTVLGSLRKLFASLCQSNRKTKDRYEDEWHFLLHLVLGDILVRQLYTFCQIRIVKAYGLKSIAVRYRNTKSRWKCERIQWKVLYCSVIHATITAFFHILYCIFSTVRSKSQTKQRPHNFVAKVMRNIYPGSDHFQNWEAVDFCVEVIYGMEVWIFTLLLFILFGLKMNIAKWNLVKGDSLTLKCILVGKQSKKTNRQWIM